MYSRYVIYPKLFKYDIIDKITKVEQEPLIKHDDSDSSEELVNM